MKCFFIPFTIILTMLTHCAQRSDEGAAELNALDVNKELKIKAAYCNKQLNYPVTIESPSRSNLTSPTLKVLIQTPKKQFNTKVRVMAQDPASDSLEKAASLHLVSRGGDLYSGETTLCGVLLLSSLSFGMVSIGDKMETTPRSTIGN